MHWQAFKNSGELIYVLTKKASRIDAKSIRRVIHIASAEMDTLYCVRYGRCWWPLHESKELRTRIRNDEGKYDLFYLNGRPLKKSDGQLPFIRSWDEHGNFYHVFGYGD